MRHAADAVDMAADEVAAEAIVGAQGLLEVHRARLGKTGGTCAALAGDVDREAALRGVEAGDRHAGAVERDAVAERDVVEIAGGRLDGETLAVRVVAQRLDVADAADAADDAGE